jgi:hypothetical protein
LTSSPSRQASAARRTVSRLTPSCSASSTSVGSRPPGNRPSAIACAGAVPRARQTRRSIEPSEVFRIPRPSLPRLAHHPSCGSARTGDLFVGRISNPSDPHD